MGKRKNIDVVLERKGFQLSAIIWILLFIFLPLIPFSYFFKYSFFEICNCANEVSVFGARSMILQIDWPGIDFSQVFAEVCACKRSLVFRGSIELFLLTMLALYIDIVWIGKEMIASLKEYKEFLFG